MGLQPSSGQTPVAFYVVDPNGSIEPFVQNAAGDAATHHTVDGVIVAGVWQHFLMTFDWSVGGAPRFYKNGAEVSYESFQTIPAQSPIDATSGQWEVGSFEGASGFNFNGLVSDIRLYNVVLSDANIALIAAGGNPSPGNLVGRWKLCGSNPEPDSSGHANPMAVNTTTSSSDNPSGAANPCSTPSDVVSETVCRPCVLYGRSPSGVLSAVTTDGNGNLNAGGAVAGFNYTQLASDNFTPDANPLNPAKWTQSGVGGGPLAAVSGKAIATSSVVGCAEYYSGVVFPADQYASMQIDVIDSAASPLNSAYIAIRENGAFDGSHRYTAGVFGPLGPSASVTLIGFPSVTIQTVITRLVAGDELRIEAFQNTITVLVNSVAVITYSGATSGPGSPLMDLESYVNASTDVKVSNFKAGSITAGGNVDTIGNSIPTPVILYGRAPNGQLQAVTTNGTGKLN